MSAAVAVSASARPAPTIGLSALPIRGLLNLFEAFERAADGLASIYTQPRCCDGFGQEEVFDEIERCNDRMQAVVREISTRRAEGTEEKRDRGEVLIRWGLKTGDWIEVGTAYAQAVAGPHS